MNALADNFDAGSRKDDQVAVIGSSSVVVSHAVVWHKWLSVARCGLMLAFLGLWLLARLGDSPQPHANHPVDSQPPFAPAKIEHRYALSRLGNGKWGNSILGDRQVFSNDTSSPNPGITKNQWQRSLTWHEDLRVTVA